MNHHKDGGGECFSVVNDAGGINKAPSAFRMKLFYLLFGKNKLGKRPFSPQMTLIYFLLNLWNLFLQ